ncbi:MAG: aldose epimerase family protein [Lachnospiraceae bacterium]|nr:aldose epimerase family protein [Lachnospiraceae bacterium]
MAVTKKEFGAMPDGRMTYLYTISDGPNTKVTVSDLGATIVSIIFQDKNENLVDVALGYDTPGEYLEAGAHFGAVVGRNGNRIANASFELNGKTYQLTANENGNNLHSGNDYFGKRLWDVKEITDQSVTFALKDADGQQGFPGNFEAQITYTLTEEGRLELAYKAVCDQDTVANLTNHVYFNLGGHDSGCVGQHEVMLNAPHYNPVIDSKAIPTGEVAEVAGTPLDFTTPHTIGERIEDDFEQLKLVGGYDHNFCIRPDRGPVIRFGEVYCPATGICMECYTDLPAVQFYTGNFITAATPEGMPGKGGAVYQKRSGFCLETQYYPNAINQEGFAKPILKAGETYETTTIYKFSVR